MIEIPRHDGADPKTCTDWQAIEIPTAIVHHLQQRNQKHFSQAQGSPFTIAPLADDLSFETYRAASREYPYYAFTQTLPVVHMTYSTYTTVNCVV